MDMIIVDTGYTIRMELYIFISRTVVLLHNFTFHFEYRTRFELIFVKREIVSSIFCCFLIRF